MTLSNMRELGVHRLVAYCLNDACRHQGLIDVSKFPDDVECRSFNGKIVRAKCGRVADTSTCGQTGRAADAAAPDREAVAVSLLIRLLANASKKWPQDEPKAPVGTFQSSATDRWSGDLCRPTTHVPTTLHSNECLMCSLTAGAQRVGRARTIDSWIKLGWVTKAPGDVVSGSLSK